MFFSKQKAFDSFFSCGGFLSDKLTSWTIEHGTLGTLDFNVPILTLPETNIFAPKNGWLEYEPFLLGSRPIFRCVWCWFQGGYTSSTPKLPKCWKIRVILPSLKLTAFGRKSSNPSVSGAMLVSGRVTVGSECLEILISHHKTHQTQAEDWGVISGAMKASQFPIGSMCIYIYGCKSKFGVRINPQNPQADRSRPVFRPIPIYIYHIGISASTFAIHLPYIGASLNPAAMGKNLVIFMKDIPINLHGIHWFSSVLAGPKETIYTYMCIHIYIIISITIPITSTNLIHFPNCFCKIFPAVPHGNLRLIAPSWGPKRSPDHCHRFIPWWEPNATWHLKSCIVVKQQHVLMTSG